MCNIWSYKTRPLPTQITRVHSSFRTAQPPTQTQTRELHKPRKCVFFVKWWESSKPPCNKSPPHLRRHILRISSIAQKTPSTTLWTTFSLTSNKNTVSWCHTNSSIVRTLSIIWRTILETQSRPYVPPLKNFFSSSTSPEHPTCNTNPWTSPTWSFKGRASLG